MAKSKDWLMLEKGESLIWPAMKDVRALMPVAVALGIGLEELEREVVEEGEKDRKVMGYRMDDCLLIHPAALGKLIGRIVRKRSRR